MTMSDDDDNRDQAIFLLTVCVVLLTVCELLTDYQLERLTDAIQDKRSDEQNEPIPNLR